MLVGKVIGYGLHRGRSISSHHPSNILDVHAASRSLLWNEHRVNLSSSKWEFVVEYGRTWKPDVQVSPPLAIRTASLELKTWQGK
jgi:hypothetical protein